MEVLKITLLLSGFLLWNVEANAAGKPCAARQIQGKSVVCVCNNTYCDEVIRSKPRCGGYVSYTSSEAGLRFSKKEGLLQSYYLWNESCPVTLELDPSTTHQTVEGFGGAVTDAAGINWSKLTIRLQDSLINSYFSAKGIEYNMLRVPIGGCDFSTHVYAYNELPENDVLLTNYTLAPEDYYYKIPMIQQIKDTATDDVHIIATTWSPPCWMKSSHKFSACSRLREEYYQTYAEYHARFVRLYKEHEIDIWGITTTNEPMDGTISSVTFQSLGWAPKGMGKWIVENLGPTFRKAADLKHVKIIAVDDQRSNIPYFFSLMKEAHPKVLDYIDGVGVHFYADKFSPVTMLELVTLDHPDKFVINTEACEGSYPWQKDKVSLGDWERAKSYISDIIEDLNANLIGWLDWNLCLDKEGGPNWVQNFVDSPIIVFPENNEFVKQPTFYAMGHVSKWIPRGSKRIDIHVKLGADGAQTIDQVAFLTPLNTVVVVIHNDGAASKVRLQLGENHLVLDLEANSITTVEMDYEN